MAENESQSPESEFTVKEGLAYMLGAIGLQLLTVMVMQWTQKFYSQPEGSGKIIPSFSGKSGKNCQR